MKKYMYIVVLLLAVMSVQAQELLNYPLDTVNGEEVYRYQVEKSIGLYRIGVNFNVSQAEIVRCNPQLRERGLHYGETLIIPTGRPVIQQTKAEVVQTVITETVVPAPSEPKPAETTDTVVTPVTDSVAVTDSIAKDTIATDSIAVDSIVQDTRKVIELALMLPFESKQTKRSSNAERMMEFYQGALMALRDMQNDSTLYRLRVYDTERSERRVNALCDSTELDSVKAILGLVYPIQIESMAHWCAEHQVPILLPFSDNIDLATHPQVLQFNSTDIQAADSLCAWIAGQENIHCVAVEVREADLTASVRSLRKQLNANQITYSGLALRDLMNDSAFYALDSSKENLLILHSDRYQQIRILLPHLEKLREAGYRIRIVSQYSWQKEGIALPQVYTSMFNPSDRLEAYDAAWRETFVNEHVSETPRYDLLGYDLMRALLGWLNTEQESKGLQSDIRWKQVENGGYQNSCVRVVVKD